ncbi:MAG: FecR domain-containing protein [Balneolales bacterium]
MLKAEYTLEELITSESFKGWVYGYTSIKERRYWDRWIAESPENRRMALKAQEQLADFSIQPSSAPDTGKSWKELQKRMDQRRFVPQLYHRNQSPLIWTMRAAAGILAILLIGIAVFESNSINDEEGSLALEQLVSKEVVTEYGERKTVRLSDGSSIILNAHSRLNYTVNEASPDEIEIELDGEAYFKVAKRTNPGDSPFHVRTSEGTVKVMGTQFVVSTRNDQTQVILEEGSVAVSSVIGNTETVMEPGQYAELKPESDNIQVKEVNLDVYTSWTTHTLVFDQTPVSQVFSRLENTFGVKIEAQDADLYERRISGSIENFGLEVIVSALSKILDTEMHIDGDAVYAGKYKNNKKRF